MDVWIVVDAAGLEQRDGNATTFRQTRRNSATRRARTDDDVVDLHAPPSVIAVHTAPGFVAGCQLVCYIPNIRREKAASGH